MGPESVMTGFVGVCLPSCPGLVRSQPFPQPFAGLSRGEAGGLGGVPADARARPERGVPDPVGGRGGTSRLGLRRALAPAGEVTS